MQIEEDIKIAVEGCGVLLYDVVKLKENDIGIFRIYISSINGITLEKCSEVSRMISPILDLYKPLNGKYNLEVSSPGIERKLKKLEHFKGSIQSIVKIKDVNLNKHQGVLQEVCNSQIILLDNNGITKTFDYDDILSASTYFDWNNLKNSQ